MKNTAPTDTVQSAASEPTADEAASDDDGSSDPESVALGSDDRYAPPHRLRDLDRWGRLWALAFAVALVLAPVQAYLQIVDDWAPHGDPARIAIQTLAVGTSDTPLTGQPSTSGDYVDAERHVDHLGPLHHYLMSGPVRVLGIHTGMLATSVVIISTCALLSAWAAFRRLGPTGGVVAAVVIGLTMFTTGTPSLTIPISSNIAGYPLFCATILMWCVLRGDLRILPLAAAMTTFAAQQHLSVVPAIAVLTPAAITGLLWHWGRHDRWRDSDARTQLARWAGAAALVSLVLWSPMLFQEATEDPGNLSSLIELTGDEDRPTLGTTAGVRQVTNVISLPPVLGRTDIDGTSGPVFLRQATLSTRLSALSVVALLSLLAWHWGRRKKPEHRSLVVMAAVTAVAGVVNGSTALDGVEALRLVFYHWVWPLTFFVTVALVLGAAEILRRAARTVAQIARRWSEQMGDRSSRLSARASGAGRPALAGLALLVVAVPPALNPGLDRPSNNFAEFRMVVERRYLTEVVDQVLTQRDLLEEPVLLQEAGDGGFHSTREALALYLIDAGVDVRLPEDERWYVPDGRLAEPGEAESGLLIVQSRTLHDGTEPDGELLADVLTVDEAWPEAVEELAAEISRGPIEFGPEIRAELDLVPDDWFPLAEEGRLAEVAPHLNVRLFAGSNEEIDQLLLLIALDRLNTSPAWTLGNVDLVEFLLDHPLRQPQIDADTIDRVHAALPDERYGAEHPARIRIYLIDKADVDLYA